MIGRIAQLAPLRIFSQDAKPSERLQEPIPKVASVTGIQERSQQAEFDAYMTCAELKHQRALLEIILDGKNHS